MSYTKGELADMALEEIGIASYEFDITVEQRQSVIRRLDAMMAEWSSRGILLAYPISKEEDSLPDDDSLVPDWTWEAIATNLAIRIAPSYGKTVSPETKTTAKRGYTTICRVFSKPKEMQFGSIPKGAGYKSIDQPYTPAAVNHTLEPIDESFDPSGEPE